MSLAKPLCQDQIDVAQKIYSYMPQWQLSDRAIMELRHAMPVFDERACLIKALAVNSLYGTNVYAIIRMGRHVHQMLLKTEFVTAGVVLVEKIAKLPIVADEKQRIHTSFASKFCHFFVDQERFPIYDEAAREKLKFHLGKIYQNSKQQPYVAFVDNVRRLKSDAGITCSASQLDRYLWITGMYDKWLRAKVKSNVDINAELKKIFEKDPSDLHRLFPSKSL